MAQRKFAQCLGEFQFEYIGDAKTDDERCIGKDGISLLMWLQKLTTAFVFVFIGVHLKCLFTLLFPPANWNRVTSKVIPLPQHFLIFLDLDLLLRVLKYDLNSFTQLIFNIKHQIPLLVSTALCYFF